MRLIKYIAISFYIILSSMYYLHGSNDYKYTPLSTNDDSITEASTPKHIKQNNTKIVKLLINAGADKLDENDNKISTCTKINNFFVNLLNKCNSCLEPTKKLVKRNLFYLFKKPAVLNTVSAIIPLGVCPAIGYLAYCSSFSGYNKDTESIYRLYTAPAASASFFSHIPLLFFLKKSSAEQCFKDVFTLLRNVFVNMPPTIIYATVLADYHTLNASKQIDADFVRFFSAFYFLLGTIPCGMHSYSLHNESKLAFFKPFYLPITVAKLYTQRIKSYITDILDNYEGSPQRRSEFISSELVKYKFNRSLIKLIDEYQSKPINLNNTAINISDFNDNYRFPINSENEFFDYIFDQ